MVGGEKAVLKRFGTFEAKIAVQLDHGVMRLDGVVAVHLNLVIVLRLSGIGQNHHP